MTALLWVLWLVRWARCFWSCWETPHYDSRVGPWQAYEIACSLEPSPREWDRRLREIREEREAGEL